MKTGTVHVATLGFEARMIPARPMKPHEAIERYLEAGDKAGVAVDVLDYGDTREPTLVVAREKSHIVGYQLVPELCPPGSTIEDLERHLRKMGMDVRGISTSRKSVLVCETTKE